MTDADLDHLRAWAAAHAPQGCTRSRQVLALLADRDTLAVRVSALESLVLGRLSRHVVTNWARKVADEFDRLAGLVPEHMEDTRAVGLQEAAHFLRTRTADVPAEIDEYQRALDTANAEVAYLRGFALSLSDRVHKQAELLSKRAERKPTARCAECDGEGTTLRPQPEGVVACPSCGGRGLV